MHSMDRGDGLERVEQRMQDLVLQVQGPAAAAALAHLAAGGGRVRARLALQAAVALGRAEREAVAVAAACELLHNASLVHDDLQDGDPLRRGRPTVWREHGEAMAVCVGDLLLSASYAALCDCGVHAARLMAAVHQRVAAVIHGQCADLRMRGRADVSLAVYEVTAAQKSGPLLSLPIELPLRLAGADAAVPVAVEAASRFAVAYQITDDLADVERDALNEELNVLAVLAATGVAASRAVAIRMAVHRYAEARTLALTLPQGAGDLLAQLAAQRMASADLREFVT